MTTTTASLAVGDKVYIGRISRGFSDTRYTKATVVKKTPAGMVDVSTDLNGVVTRFRVDGRALGNGDPYGPFLEDAETAERILAGRLAQNEALHAVYDLRKFAAVMNPSMADVADLEKLVAALKAKIAARDAGN